VVLEVLVDEDEDEGRDILYISPNLSESIN
jgi:hypothetical protein